MESLHGFVFWVIAGLTGACAIATVVSHNIVRSATWLLFTLAGVSALFFLMGADIVGAIQLLVYVGGTLVLVVFGVMLTAQGPFISMRTSAAEWVISVVAGLMLLSLLVAGALSIRQPDLARSEALVQYAPKKNVVETPATSRQSTTIGQGLLGVGVGPAHSEGSQVVRTSYLLPFEIVSVHLLVVLIGAAYLARTKRRRAAEA